MNTTRADRLDHPVDPQRDHILGNPDAELTLVEYGSYVCSHCHAAQEVIANLRDRFGDRMRYVFRQLPLPGDDGARSAAIAEFADMTTDQFWPVHDALMRTGPSFAPGTLDGIASRFGLPTVAEAGAAWNAAEERAARDAHSGRSSGAHGTPTFFINGRRYEGAWDETSLAEAMLGSLGHRLHTASLDFARWAPSTGVLLLVMSLAAVFLTNSRIGGEFSEWWQTPVGLRFGSGAFTMPLLQWVNDGLLTIFFLVVGLEIKRELTVGRLATRRAAMLPVAAAIGGMVFPALLYSLIVGSGAYAHAWGITIATDTAFAVALIVLLGDRVPVDLRVFLTAAVIVDDLVAIVVVALFYSGALHLMFLGAAAVATLILLMLNRMNVYRSLPYAVVGVILWFCLHEGGLHATLAGVILAIATPTRPPPNLHALTAQAQSVLQAELRDDETMIRHGPSEPALNALDAIHDRIESPASKLLRAAEPWSSYVVLPVFALANAGVLLSTDVVASHGRLMSAIIAGLVIGKPAGIFMAARLAVLAGIADKPAAYTWRQLAGAGALAGIGFTMSLFIAGQAFPNPDDFAAAKIAIFAASIVAGIAGATLLAPRARASADGDSAAR